MQVRGMCPLMSLTVLTRSWSSTVAVNNPWFGSQLAYTIGGTNDLSDNFLVAAAFIYDPLGGETDDKGDPDRFHLPVVANFSPLGDAESADDPTADELKDKLLQMLNSPTGVSVGVYPYYVAVSTPKNDAKVRVTIHGAAGLKLNNLKAPDGENVLFEQARLSAGAELAVGRFADGRDPLTISLAPVFTAVSADDRARVFGERKTLLTSFEATVVFPLGRGFGVLAEGVFGQNDARGLRVGLLAARAVK